jgi:hypothetical protein
MFSRKIKKEIDSMLGSIDPNTVVNYKINQLVDLPEPVHRYFRYVLKDGQEYINHAKIRQSGLIRLKRDQKWMPLKAVQYFNCQRPGFIWIARAQLLPFVWFSARDKYSFQKGGMLIKLFSVFNLINAIGCEIDISSFIRYFSEAPLFPTSLLPSKYLKWKSVTENSVNAVVNDGKNKATIKYSFNNIGEIMKISTFDRFRAVNGKYYKEKWTGYFDNYKEIIGIKIPTEIEAEWNLKEGNFKYVKIKIEDVNYS